MNNINYFADIIGDTPDYTEADVRFLLSREMFVHSQHSFISIQLEKNHSNTICGLFENLDLGVSILFYQISHYFFQFCILPLKIKYTAKSNP